MEQDREIELIYGINTLSCVMLAVTGHKTPLPFMIIYLKMCLNFLMEIEGMPIPVEVKAGARSETAIELFASYENS
jgi:hypothetical protein